jgi:hypothetical protein
VPRGFVLPESCSLSERYKVKDIEHDDGLDQGVEEFAIRRRRGTHNRLENSSIAFTTAYEKSTIKQTLVNAIFCHRELGIKAGFCCRSCRRSQKTKAGTSPRLTHSRDILAGCRMCETPLVNALHAAVSLVQ